MSFKTPFQVRRLLLVGALLLAGSGGQASADCSLTSLGLVPLSDSARTSYRGQQGGLYPGGSSRIPDRHLGFALQASRRIRPLDAQGRTAPNGRIVLVSVGMSNTRMGFGGFLARSNVDPGRNPQLLVVNGAQDAMTADTWMHPSLPTWRILEDRLRAAGATPAQVQVAWIKLTDPLPARNGTFPEHARLLQTRLEGVVRSLRTRFPNIQLAYLSSRTRAYAVDPAGLSPEPWAYETGFSVRWLIEKQMAGDPTLNFDAALGPVVAPIVLWGPYLWADGTTMRSDGFQWQCNDLVNADFVHPSNNGIAKVGTLLHTFFKSDPTTVAWYLRQNAGGTAPTCQITATPGSGRAPLAVAFRGVGSDPDGRIAEYAWSFADGTGALTQSPGKLFRAPNLYPVHLTVTDDDGNTGHCQTEIRVPEPSPAALGGFAPLLAAAVAFARRRRRQGGAPSR